MKFSQKQNFKILSNAPLRGYNTLNLKLARPVCYLKIINTFLKNNMCILKQIIQGTKNGIEILVGQIVFKVMDQNNQNIALISYSRITWPTYILMLF